MQLAAKQGYQLTKDSMSSLEEEDEEQEVND